MGLYEVSMDKETELYNRVTLMEGHLDGLLLKDALAVLAALVAGIMVANRVSFKSFVNLLANVYDAVRSPTAAKDTKLN
jgi:hypothetical protein